MIKNTLKIYVLSFIILNFVFGLYFGVNHLDIFIFNLIFGLLYAFVIYPNNLNLKKNSLLFVCTIYSVFFIILINYLSYQNNGNYFVFSEADSILYDQKAKEIIYNISALPKVLSEFSFDDWGGILMVSLAYLLGPSNLSLNLLYWLMGIISTAYLYKLASYFMNQKYAFYCALAFSLSSFVLWFEASGLKESAIIFLVILTYYHFYTFQFKRKYFHLIIGLISLVLLLFFRAGIPIIIGGSFLLSTVLQRKSNPINILIGIVIITVSISFSFVFEFLYNRFFYVDRDISFMEVKESTGMIKGGLFLTIVINIIAGLVGPLPTFITTELNYLSIFSSGLFLKNFLSFGFITGTFLIIKERFYAIFPIMLFPVFEMLSLVILLESLELRKSLPHFPMLYLIIFWFFYKQSLIKKNTLKNRYKNSYFIYIIVVLVMVIIWNLRNQ